MNKREKAEQSSSHREKKVKRVKTHHVRTSPLILKPVDCFLLEEKESEKLSSELCFAQFQETCTSLREKFQNVYTMKKEHKNEDKIGDWMTDVCMLIMGLKKLSRLDKHHCKKSRDVVNDGKQKVDNLNLQYQNLLYEITHLQKEVTKCLEFRSQDEEIELVPVEEFYKEAPKSISRPDITKHDNHELTIARLEWELEQRKRLAKKLKEAEVTKSEYKEKIQKLKECLDNIQPTLLSVLEAAEPLQSKLGMPLQVTQPKNKIAKFLPKPLYVLYTEVSAYREACDKKVHVFIEGNIDEAKLLQLKMEDVVDDSGESDPEENSNMKRHRHSISVRRVDSDKDILRKHPLSVCITVSAEGIKLCIEFCYLPHLQVITARTKSLSQCQSSPFAGNLLKLDSFLNCLYPDDHGRESPNPANKYQLLKLGYEESPFAHGTTGWPYIWAQRISGLNFISDQEINQENIVPSPKISFSSMEQTLSAVWLRLKSRMFLNSQILSLESGTSVPPDLAQYYPCNVVSRLRHWYPVSWEEVQKHPNCSELLDLNIISQDSLTYKAIIERGSAILQSVVVVPPDYSIRSPLFLLFLQWKTNSTSANSMALQELEEEVNVHFVESFPAEHRHNLFQCQLYHLLVCFDVFLETEGSGEIEGPREFLLEKVVTRISRGRSHSRPYKYIPSKGIFTHR